MTSMACSWGVVSAVGEFRPNSEAGIVDQHVDRLLGAGQPLRNPDHLTAYGQIGDDRLHADCVRSFSSVAISESRSALRATSTRSSPRAASARAKAAPMPDVPPVISAVAMRSPYACRTQESFQR